MKTREELWENQMVDRGVERYLLNVKRAKTRVTKSGARVQARDEASTSYGVGIMREVFGPYEDCIDWFIVDRMSRKFGRIDTSVQYLAACETKEVAYIAAKTIIDSISRVEKQTKVALRIAGHLEDQMRMSVFQEAHPKYYRAIVDDMTKRRINNYRAKRKTLVSCHNKAAERDRMAGLEVEARWIPWPKRDKLQIGLNLIDMLILATSDYQDGKPGVNNCYQNERRIAGTGFIERVTKKIAGHPVPYITGTIKAQEYIKANMEICELLYPEFLPTLVQPIDWTTPYDGGYHIHGMRGRKPLVKSSKEHLQELELTYMPDVYSAVNIAQSVPWEINSEVYEAMLDEWRAPHGIGFPGNEPIKAPPCPLGELEQGDMSVKEFLAYKRSMAKTLTDDQRAAFAQWKRDQHECEIKEAERVAKLINLSGIIRVAKQMYEHDEFYYVHTLDYRSRMYACGSGLNIQGTDLSKALLRFKRGTKLGKWGYKHLCIHAAGTYGMDKVSLEDRVQWVKDNRLAILKTGLAPEDMRDFWGAADKPYMFLAACFELADIFATVNPPDVNNCLQNVQDVAFDYVCHLPGPQDGSCNGIQHFSAMLLDPVGAKAVNMMDVGRVCDIYQDTADFVIDDLKRAIKTGFVRNGNSLEKASPEQLKLIDDLLNRIKITRKTTKKSTMVIPYGGTKRSCLKSVKEYVEKVNAESADENGVPVFDSKQVYAASLMLHHYVWHALDTVVVAARKAMKFLRGIAKVNNRLSEPLRWRTPSGFLVMQRLRDSRKKTVNTYLCGRMRVKYLEPADGLNKHKMSSSFPPNFVHSMDASHLMITINMAHEAGIEDFALVHDSFAVPFGQVEMFHQVIREAFVSIYKNNVLKGLLFQQLGQFPDMESSYPDPNDVKRGDFDINEVLKATYFFR